MASKELQLGSPASKYDHAFAGMAQGCQVQVYFHTKNPNLGIGILEIIGKKNVGIFYANFE
jgi:hypothetical protein